MPIRRAVLLLAFVATRALAGTYDQPYAMVEPGDRSEVRKEFRPVITKIDGKSPGSSRRFDALPPGKHQVTINFETARVQQSNANATRTVELDLEPCMRYRLVARRTEGNEWEPHVYSEPMDDCMRKFKLPK
jgi:hypothetical protein